MSGDEAGVGAAGDVGFEIAVRAIIAPVLAESGLVVVDSGDREVRFESPLVWACAFHEERSEAVGFHFNRRDTPDELDPFDVSHAMRLIDRAAAVEGVDPSAKTVDEVRRALEDLKRDIETYCGEALRGDPAVFVAMKQESDLYQRQYAAWTRRSKEMGRGEAIFRGDWDRVVEIYEAAEQDLITLQQRRLEVARQNVRTLRALDPISQKDPELFAEMHQAYQAFLPQDGRDDEYRNLELAVGQAMDAGDWQRVVDLYEGAPGDLEYMQRRRLNIARRQLDRTD